MSATVPAPAPSLVPTSSGPIRPRAADRVDRGTVHHLELRAGRWRTSGIVKVDRDVSVGRAELRGIVVVGGALLAGELDARASLDVRGAIAVTASFRLRGSLAARAGARAADLALSGTVESLGELTAERSLGADGIVRAPTLRAPSVRLRGTAHVPGAIEATSVDASFLGDSELGEVRARTVRLRGPAPNLVRSVLGRAAVVSVRGIEAESVRLEAVRAEFVRAREIVLGRYAHLLAHEGTVVRAHPTSRIGPESWTPAPPGLRR